MRKKYAERIDGVDLSRYRVGDTLNLPPKEALLLLAEDWASPERRVRSRSDPQQGGGTEKDVRNCGYGDWFRAG